MAWVTTQGSVIGSCLNRIIKWSGFTPPLTPPGYRRKKRPARPKLDPFDGIIDQILEKNIQNIGIWVNAHVRRYYPFGKRAMIGTGGTRHATPSTP